jgi:CHRD domain-containing protein
MRSRLLVPVVALALTGAIASCSDEITALNRSFEKDATWTATLASEVAGVPATATGRAWLVDRGNTIDFYMDYSGLTSNVTNAHIHRTATSGVLIQLPFVRQTSGVVVATIDVSAGVTDISPSPPGETGTQTVAEFRTLLGNGGVYVNVHTVNNPGGEIRGTINPK